jgi:hypothetical protein
VTSPPDRADGVTAGEALLARVTPLDLRADLQPPSVVAGVGGTRTLRDPSPLVAHLEAGLFTPVPGYPPAGLVTDDAHRRTLVAASVGCQSVVARVATTVLLGVVVDRQVLTVDLDDLRWWPDRASSALGLVSVVTEPLGHHTRGRPQVEGEGPTGRVGDLGRVVDRLVRAVCAPWVAAVRAATDAPERLLWGDVAAALATGATTACRVGDLTAGQHRHLIDHVADTLPLSDLVTRAPGLATGWRRTTCCLIVDAGLAPCDECPRPTS